ncbi:MAG: helix-turn-helix domain-containing protein [Rhodopila sp.]|nr:helix-turn-helix domain-containing protein [Rhodopila sp.]
MVKRTSLKRAECPVARSLDAIGDWWSLLIVRDAFDGARRFGEFQNSLGISKGILTTRLRDLVAQGVLDTVPASDGSAYQDYVLTKKGQDLFPIVVGLRQWGEDHCFEPGEAHSVLVDNETAERVGRLEIRSRSGRAVGWADTTVRKAGTPSPVQRRSAPAKRSRRSASTAAGP